MRKSLSLLILFIITFVFLPACSQISNIRYIDDDPPATPLPLIVPEKSEAEVDNLLDFVPSPTNYIPVNDVQITEINSSGTDWIEFHNCGNTLIHLSDFKIGKSAEYSDAVSLPEVNLKPGEYCCVYGKNENESVKADFSISKSGDTLILFRKDGSIVSSISIPALSDNVSLVCTGGNWSYTYYPTPGYPNSDVIFSVSSPESYDDSCPLIISEVLVSNSFAVVDSYSQNPDFVEIYNSTNSSISLYGWFLSDSSENLAKWAFPNISIPPGQYVVVYLSGNESSESELHASFCLNSEESVYLLNGNENRLLTFVLPSVLIKNISVGPNGTYYRFPTPGYKNSEEIKDIANIGFYFSDDVYISEVCALGDNTDWIEIHNGSDAPIDISGWFLTDTLSDIHKYVFPQTVLSPGDYYVIEASSHLSEQNGQVAKFGVSLSGDTIYLLDSNGRVRDMFETGLLAGAASSGRIESNTSIRRVFFTVSSPGKKNSNSYFTGRTSEPVFSCTSLYCTEKFTLTISAEDGADIYYTSDGSAPKPSARYLYNDPITISKNTVIRAIAVKDGSLCSQVVTYTYLFEEPHSIPVICIAMNPSDKDAVWSAKSKQSSTKVEREGFLTYYEADGKLGVSFPAGFKPKGAGTLGRSQASLSIHLRGVYGQSNVTYPFFSEYGWTNYASLVIRNSGQDYTKGRIRDSLASRICFGLNIDVAATKPVAVYVNGKYYGLYDLNEDQNADFLHTHYGVDTRTVEIIRFNTVTVKGSNTNWKKVIDFAKTKNFKSADVYEEFIQWVDPDYFMDYLICSIYLCNSDMANQKYWHTTDNVIRWRPIFYDFDYAIGFNRSPKSSIMERFFDPSGTATATSRVYTYIACALVKNPEWRNRFIERFIELTYTIFAPERVNEILDQLVGEMEPEMPRHIARWGSRNAPASIRDWHDNIDAIKDWFAKRQVYAIDSLKKYFGLSEADIDRIRSKYIYIP